MPLPDVRPVDDDEDPIDFLAENLTGSLLKVASCDWLRDGTTLAGDIGLSVLAASINTGVSPNTATIVVTPDHTTHPQGYPAPDQITGVKLDGATHYIDTVVRGADLVFNDRAAFGIVDTNTAHVVFGEHVGTFEDGNPDGTNPGDPVVGPRRRAIKNFGTTLKTDVTISIARPVAVMWRKTGVLFSLVRVANDSPVEIEAVGTLRTMPYKFSAANLDTGANRIDIKVSGGTYGSTPVAITTVRYLDTSPTTTSDSLQLLRGGRYRIESGGASGIEFTVGAAAANTSTANVAVWDRRCIRISADNSGSAAVDWDDPDQGYDDVVIPTLDPDEVAYYWEQIDANVGSGEKNPIQLHPRISWLETGVSGIEEA